MAGKAETEKKQRKDPSGRVVLGICLIVSICIYLLRGQLPQGKELWWAWIMVGIGILVAVESVYREFNLRNRWSTYVRCVIGAFVAEVGVGFIVGFGELRILYMGSLVSVIVSAVLSRHKFVKA